MEREKLPDGHVHRAVLSKDFFEKVKLATSPEEKVEIVLLFMQQKLEERGHLHFKEFWEAKEVCLGLFHSLLNPTAKVTLWTRYGELCHEAKMLKELFEKESSYIVEQAESAINALSSEIHTFFEGKAPFHPVHELETCRIVRSHIKEYGLLQNELYYLTIFSSQIQAFRKELLKDEIKYVQRKRLLERLRRMGDEIYPRKKSGMAEISELFLKDLDLFVQSFSPEKYTVRDCFHIQDEIKQLQKLSKMMALHSEAFSRSRNQLSECWNKIKQVLREKKKEQHEKFEKSKKHKEQIDSCILAIRTQYETGEMDKKEAFTQIKKIFQEAQSASLSHRDFSSIRQDIQLFEEIVDQKKEERDPISKQKEEIFSYARSLLEKDVPDIEEAVETVRRDAESMGITHAEKSNLDGLVLSMRDKIEEYYRTQISFSKEKKRVTLKFCELLISSKVLLEIWRKERGEFSGDFALEMEYLELMEKERARVGRIEEYIRQLGGSEENEQKQ